MQGGKMNYAKNQRSCRDVQLDVLLFGDEHSAEYRGFAAHVEMCRPCQERLSEMAADESDWTNARTMLSGKPPDVVPKMSGAEDDSGLIPNASTRPIKLDFLLPPSHPEMLGRLDRYEIEQVIGKGGMGIVLKGYDTELNRPVAIKVLAPHLAHSGAAKQRFARESRAAASIVHEHVVAIHDVKSERDAPFLVMQYVSGRSLQERVEHEGPLATLEILRIGMQAAAGLAAAHNQGVIHRDVKPANILSENGVERAMLTDFGLARAADDATLTHSGIIAGTPHYMSPEQARGAPADARSDLFSLGAVLYFMATGHPPFRAEQAMAILHRICQDRHRPVQTINADIPDALASAIDRLLEKKPSRRFATAGEVQQSLARLLIRTQQPRPWRNRWLRRISRRHRLLLAAACVLLASVGIGWFSGWLRPASTNKTATLPQVSAPATEVLANEFLSQQGEFVNDSAAISRLLKQIEDSPYPESIVRLPADSWVMELKAADAEVSRFEQQWSLESNHSSSLGTLKEETP